MFNNDADYARSRLATSFMRGSETNKGLFKILDILSKDNKLDTARIIAYDQNRKERQLNIKDLSFSVGRLGYVNEVLSGNAMFVSRLPLRRDFRQGIRSTQLCFVRNYSTGGVSENWLDQNAKSLNKCLEEKYPDFDTVLEQVEEANVDIAFSRNFAMSNKYKLLYKGCVIGDLTKEDKFKLHHQFNFVEDEFIKDVGNDKLSR